MVAVLVLSLARFVLLLGAGYWLLWRWPRGEGRWTLRLFLVWGFLWIPLWSGILSFLIVRLTWPLTPVSFEIQGYWTAVWIEPWINGALAFLPFPFLLARVPIFRQAMTISRSAYAGLVIGAATDLLENLFDVLWSQIQTPALSRLTDTVHFQPLLAHWLQYLVLGWRLWDTSGNLVSAYSMAFAVAFLFAFTAWGFRRGGVFRWAGATAFGLVAFEHAVSNLRAETCFFGVCPPLQVPVPIAWLWNLDGHGWLSASLLVGLVLYAEREHFRSFKMVALAQFRKLARQKP